MFTVCLCVLIICVVNDEMTIHHQDVEVSICLEFFLSVLGFLLRVLNRFQPNLGFLSHHLETYFFLIRSLLGVNNL